jgi:hypothetical protein
MLHLFSEMMIEHHQIAWPCVATTFKTEQTPMTAVCTFTVDIVLTLSLGLQPKLHNTRFTNTDNRRMNGVPLYLPTWMAIVLCYNNKLQIHRHWYSTQLERPLSLSLNPGVTNFSLSRGHDLTQLDKYPSNTLYHY